MADRNDDNHIARKGESVQREAGKADRITSKDGVVREVPEGTAVEEGKEGEASDEIDPKEGAFFINGKPVSKAEYEAHLVAEAPPASRADARKAEKEAEEAEKAEKEKARLERR